MIKPNKILTTSFGKNIHIYENCFDLQKRSQLYKFFLQSLFKVNGSDEGEKNYQIYSNYSENDLNNSGFTDTNFFSEISERYDLNKRTINQIRVNCSYSSENNYVHQDSGPLTVLYYPNLNWDIQWSGHTLFLSEDLSDIEQTICYKPGRVVVFDGTIPHMIMSPTFVSQVPRLSLAIQYLDGDRV